MSYEFTKLSEVEFAEQPSTEANILIEDNGDIKKTLLANIGSSGSGTGVETIDFTINSYAMMLEDFESVKKAFSNNMTFHIILKTDAMEEGDGMNLIHVSFPRINEFGNYLTENEYIASTMVPVWLISEEKFISLPVGMIFSIQPEDEQIMAGIQAYWEYEQNFEIKACYATTV